MIITNQGDSGGPLVLQQNGQYVLTGVVSYGGDVCNGSNLTILFILQEFNFY